MSEKRMNVRCCCDPSRVLGSLPAAFDKNSPGSRVRFPLMDLTASVRSISTQYVELEVARAMHQTDISDTVRKYAGLGIVELIQSSDFNEIAYKSDQTEMETLKRIPGFIPA